MKEKQKNYDYFEFFIDMCTCACDAADFLLTVLSNYTPEALRGQMDEMHDIEHTADEKKHGMMKALAREFIPPLEREDIVMLSQQLDEIIDSTEDVLLRFYMFNIGEVREDAIRFSEMIVECCKELKELFGEFRNYKKSSTREYLREHMVSINHQEEEGDRLYTEAIHTLYAAEKDALTVTAWKEIIDRLEKCCDACEHSANVAESILMKMS